MAKIQHLNLTTSTLSGDFPPFSTFLTAVANGYQNGQWITEEVDYP